MEARPVISDIPNSLMRNPTSEEAEEFKRLIAESSVEHKKRLYNSLMECLMKTLAEKKLFFCLKTIQIAYCTQN